MKKSSPLTAAHLSRNRALMWCLFAAAAVFYIVSYIRTGDALRGNTPVSRFPADHEHKPR